jgi:SET domain-containing protein
VKKRSSPVGFDPPLPARWVVRRERSAIHGHGVYARVDIPAGYVIVEYVGERITKAESNRREIARLERLLRGGNAPTYVFRLDDRHDLDARRGGNVSRWINHSCAPNCRALKDRGRIWILADRDIAADEEITFDYGYRFRDWQLNPCRCGASPCLGYIVAADQRWRLRRALAREKIQTATES